MFVCVFVVCMEEVVGGYFGAREGIRSYGTCGVVYSSVCTVE